MPVERTEAKTVDQRFRLCKGRPDTRCDRFITTSGGKPARNALSGPEILKNPQINRPFASSPDSAIYVIRRPVDRFCRRNSRRLLFDFLDTFVVITPTAKGDAQDDRNEQKRQNSNAGRRPFRDDFGIAFFGDDDRTTGKGGGCRQGDRERKCRCKQLFHLFLQIWPVVLHQGNPHRFRSIRRVSVPDQPVVCPDPSTNQRTGIGVAICRAIGPINSPTPRSAKSPDEIKFHSQSEGLEVSPPPTLLSKWQKHWRRG